MRAIHCKQSCWSSANHSGSASEWKEFPHQSQSKGSLTHYRFMASSTYKYISTKRLLLLIHVTNFARYCILWIQICPVSGAPLVCVRSTFGPSPNLYREVEITGPVITTKTRTLVNCRSFQGAFPLRPLPTSSSPSLLHNETFNIRITHKALMYCDPRRHIYPSSIIRWTRSYSSTTSHDVNSNDINKIQ